MKTIAACLLPLFLFGFSFTLQAQNALSEATESGGEDFSGINDANTPCITEQQYAELEQRCADNAALLGIAGTGEKSALITSLSWPLHAANGLSDCSLYFISAYVDHNTTTGVISDYNCGTRTYDGHRGTDIAIAPYPFYKMDNNQVEVIAAAAGTIIDKSDGNFDKNCSTNSMTANYIVIQHPDGSRAFYWHMKKNSVTTKTIGQSVAVGEYLGVVGSSGDSSGPHLHFEVWAGSTTATRVDPYFGACNLLNPSSWWAAQKPYTEPSIIKSSVNITDIVTPACPATETPNESSCYSLPFQGPGLPAGAAKFYIFMRNETAGMTATMSILNPDATTFATWTYTSASTYNFSYRAWTKFLPTTSGTYTFQAIYNGITCSKTFDINNATITPGGSTTLCQGSTVNLTASAGSAFLWSNGATTQTVSVSAAGDYTVTVTSANACSDVSTATSVTVSPAPVATITPGGATTFCQGGSVTLSASAASSYLWSNGGTTQNISVSTSGTYKVTVTNANGCTAVSTGTVVTVNPLPVATVTPGGATTFCQGGSVTLSASAAGSYLWSNGGTTQNISVSASGTYKVTVTNAGGCSAVSSGTVVTVNPLPVATVTPGGATTFCQGGSVMLSASAANSYSWSNGATSQIISASNSGNYIVTVTNAGGCSAVSSATAVTVNPLPVAVITPGGATTFCQGGSVTLSASTNGSYLWSNGSTSQVINVSNSGNYIVTVTNAGGCSAISTATAVTVNPLPVAVITPGGATTFCQGGSVTLSASAAGSYLWSNGATSQVINVSNSGNYIVTVTYAGGCSAVSAATAVMVNPLPVATVTPGGATTFCQGGSVTLSASAASSYLWSNGATSQVINVSNSGNYIVTVTNAGGCSAVSSATAVTVNPLPVAVITPGGATTFCQGGSVTLSASANGSYLWSNGSTSQVINVSNSGNYIVTVTNGGGCSAVSSATAVTVNPLPVATVTPGGATTFCEGGSVTLSASAAGSYLWSNGATSQVINVSNSGNYIVTVTNGGGCSAVSAATAVTVNPLPIAMITPGGATTFCQGGSVTLSASAAGSYLWSNGATSQVINVSISGNYIVTVTNAGGCSAVSSATAVTVNPLPLLPTISANGILILTSSYAAGNQWYLNGNVIAGANLPTYTVTQNGNYTVLVTDANGCTATSAVFNFINTGIPTITENNALFIIPNPNNGTFTIAMQNGDISSLKGEIEIYNLLGERVLFSDIQHLNAGIDISEQPNGIYFVRINSSNGIQTIKVIKN